MPFSRSSSTLLPVLIKSTVKSRLLQDYRSFPASVRGLRDLYTSARSEFGLFFKDFALGAEKRNLSATAAIYGQQQALPTNLSRMVADNSSASATLLKQMHQPAVNSNVGVVDVIDDIVKPPHDDRQYRSFTLGNNQLKVLIVQDATSEKSAASLDIHIGTMQDPKEAQGLAHFLEHMVFLGSKKYTTENEFDSYVASHGGSYNAYTSEEHTNFYFDVAAEHLQPALDRFAQFFISPLMSESGTEREVKAVNSEHTNNITSDHWRLDAVGRVCADPTHPWNYFGTGNIDTLWNDPRRDGTDVRGLLLAFHKRWYSANIMSLCILGRESLDELQQLAINLFNLVPTSDVKLPYWDRAPLRDPEDLGKIIYYTPVQDIRTLAIEWPTPDYEADWRSKPLHYLSDLIGHEGSGSILSQLKRRNWALSLAAGCEDRARGFATFSVHVQLSVDGLQHIDDIIAIIYKYLYMLKREGPRRDKFDELAQLDRIKFTFRDKVKPIGAVRAYAHDLHEYPARDMLQASFTMTDWKPELISEALGCFVPQRMRILVTAKDFAGRENNKFEKYYNAEFACEKLSAERLEKWSEKSVSKNFDDVKMRMPEPNLFIPHKFEIKSEDNGKQALSEAEKTKDPVDQPIKRKYPFVIHETALSKWWYKIDDQFRLPKAVVDFEIMSPCVYESAKNANLSNLLVALFHDGMAELTYPAELAGLRYVLSSTKYGLLLTVRGFDEKQPQFVRTILESLIKFEVDEERFNNFKEAYARGLKNFYASEPFKQTDWYFRVLMTEKNFTKDELIASLETETTITGLRELQKVLLKSVKVEGLIHGNVRAEEAKSIAELVDDVLQNQAHSKPASEDDIARQRLVQLPPSSFHILSQTNNVHLANCAALYYQVGTESPRQNVLMELTEQILCEPCFDQLRTKEQLGYIVFTSAKSITGVNGFQVCVQSAKSPEYLDDRIERFLREMERTISTMDDVEFKKHVEAVATRRLEKPKSMMQRAERYWNEIFVRMYHFARDEIEVAELRRLTTQDVLEFMRQYIVAPHTAATHQQQDHSATTSDDADKNRKDNKHSLSSSSDEGRQQKQPKQQKTESDSDADKNSSNALIDLSRDWGRNRAKLSIHIRSTAPPDSKPPVGLSSSSDAGDTSGEQTENDEEEDESSEVDEVEKPGADGAKKPDAAIARTKRSVLFDPAVTGQAESVKEKDELASLQDEVGASEETKDSNVVSIGDVTALGVATTAEIAIDREAHSSHAIVHAKPSTKMIAKDALHAAMTAAGGAAKTADEKSVAVDRDYEPSDMQKNAVKIADGRSFKEKASFHNRPPVYNDDE